jgi:serine/threonine protein kinase
MWQLLDGVRHMHRKGIIHRDLKLGNLFLTRDMTLKIGDYGLAASLKHDGERKKYAFASSIFTGALMDTNLGPFAGHPITLPLKFCLIHRMDIALKLTSGLSELSCNSVPCDGKEFQIKTWFTGTQCSLASLLFRQRTSRQFTSMILIFVFTDLLTNCGPKGKSETTHMNSHRRFPFRRMQSRSSHPS